MAIRVNHTEAGAGACTLPDPLALPAIEGGSWLQERFILAENI